MSLKTERARKHYRALLHFHPFCHYCGAPVARKPASTGIRRATADHIVPRAYGGNDNPVNIVVACFSCNQHKAHRTDYCWCDQCCEALAYYATKWLDPAASGYRFGLKTAGLNDLARQGRVA